ncbi:hypothetical protein chiPu_0028128, partial [Chiloscyllium punctatum]|nr:hypothetical protein [Chiloscyllium punctatum]
MASRGFMCGPPRAPDRGRGPCQRGDERGGRTPPHRQRRTRDGAEPRTCHRGPGWRG